MLKSIQLTAFFSALLAIGCATSVALAHTAQQNSFKLSSPEFKDGGNLPTAYTCDGQSASPPVAWTNPPAGTQAYALTMDHIARDNERHVYWLILNIPGSKQAIAKNERPGIMGHNTMNPRAEYSPPCSKGPGPKEYVITLYALSKAATLPAEPPTMDELLAAIKDRTLAKSTLKVIYSRPNSQQ